MTYTQVIEKSTDFVKKRMLNSESGHNWFHVYRVWILAKQIAESLKANMLIVELGALFHDIADPKFHNGDREVAPRITREFLNSLAIDQEIIEQVIHIVNNVSFSKTKGKKGEFQSLELDIVQDADRLEAIGAIGIARSFHYGGYKNNEIYNPNILPNSNGVPTTINHFYEKLLLLKDLMNTDMGRKIAIHRHKYMENFLNEFYKEWNLEI